MIGKGDLSEIYLDNVFDDERDRDWLDRMRPGDLTMLFRALEREVKRRGGIKKLEREEQARLEELFKDDPVHLHWLRTGEFPEGYAQKGAV